MVKTDSSDKSGGAVAGKESDSVKQVVCSACQKPEAPGSPPFSVCSACRKVFYCDKDCQRWHWRKGGHKQECGKLVNEVERIEEEATEAPRRERQDVATAAASSSSSSTKPNAIRVVCIGENGSENIDMEITQQEFEELKSNGVVPPLPKQLGVDIFIGMPNDSEDVAWLMMHPTTGEILPFRKDAIVPCIVAYSDGASYSTDDLAQLMTYLGFLRDQGFPPPEGDVSPHAFQMITSFDKGLQRSPLAANRSSNKSDAARCVRIDSIGSEHTNVEISQFEFEVLKRTGTAPLLPSTLGIDIVISNVNANMGVRLLMMDPTAPTISSVLTARRTTDPCIVASIDGRPFTTRDHFCLVRYIKDLCNTLMKDGKLSSWSLSPLGFQQFMRSDGLREYRHQHGDYELGVVLAPRVRQFGLTSQVKLNGQEGFRGRWNEKDERFQVFLDEDDEKTIRLIKPWNIQVLPDTSQ